MTDTTVDLTLDKTPIKTILPKTIDDLTVNSLSGKGAFDRLMQSVELHIQDEHKKGRITGANYAQVYMQAIQYVLQFATQFTLSQDQPYLEAEKLRIEKDKANIDLEKLKLELEIAKVDLEIKRTNLEIAKAQLEQEKQKIPLIKAQTLSELAKTKDIIPNDEECYEGENFNVHGEMGMQIRTAKASIVNAEKASALSLAKEFAIVPFTTIESAEGIGAGYYALNGGNSIVYINNLRKAFGLEELDTTTYAGAHKQYMDKYAPDVKLETDD